MKFIAVMAMITLLPGCAVLFGSDVQGLSEVREEHVKVFDKDAAYCYERTRFLLTKWGAVAYDRIRNEYIVAMELEKIFPSCINTTELGIFFTEVGPHRTEVKVTSLNYNLSQYVAKRLFADLEKDARSPARAGTPQKN